MLEITRQDIAGLSDAALSELVERLCEAELAKRGVPTSALTTGGPQDASDGGVDLAVDADAAIAECGYIPRARTVFQVKATSMPPSKVIGEMRPQDVLRPAIFEVLAGGGAYVIACSKTAPAGTKLAAVRKTMSDAAGAAMVPGAVVDFLGPDRLVLWCRRHPGVLSWARWAAGRPMAGWAPFGNWSRTDESAEAEFILDDDARLVDERTQHEGALPIVLGLDRMRQVATRVRTSIRLVGLSGVGKTRLVQALFDGRVGSAPLPDHAVLYGDNGDDVSPSALEMARQLAARGDRIVLVIDNCSSELHRRLSEIICAAPSQVSLVTIEYDVRDDVMEGTEVFRLEPASEAVTDSLIERRYAHINAPDRRQIAELAGGNARIAMALADTVRKGETLGRLRDEVLFERLFYQRSGRDDDLLAAAEVAALVYSFDGETLSTAGELAALAGLAEQSVTKFLGRINTLKRRDLVQRRSKWRAILPHAVANRLAARALETLDPVQVAATLELCGDRLLKSFTRRLSYLHDVPAARDLAAAWFSPEGRLGQLRGMREFRFSLFRNLAPLAPAAALSAISRAAAADPSWGGFRPAYSHRQSREELARLLRGQAFEAELFEEAAERLVELAALEQAEPNRKSITSALQGLFGLHMSRTAARPSQRLGFVRGLIADPNSDRATLGLSLLNAMLESHWFGAHDSLDFGARPRGPGWEPAGNEALDEWYGPAIALLTELATTPSSVHEQAKHLLAARIASLWRDTGLTASLTSVVDAVAAQGFWVEGWVAVRSALRFLKDEDDAADLAALEARLRPRDLREKVRTFGLFKSSGALYVGDLDDDDDDVDSSVHPSGSSLLQGDEYVKALGMALAVDDVVRASVLQDLVQGDIQRHWALGEGLALGAPDRGVIWRELVDAITAAPPETAEPAMLRSYLRAWAAQEPGAVESLFDDLLVDQRLGRWFPFLQCSVLPLGARAVERIKASLELGLTSGWSYHFLGFGGILDPIDPDDCAAVIAGVARLERGYLFALELFHMRILSDKKTSIPVAILATGRALLHDYPLAEMTTRGDRRLSELVEVCLTGPENAALAERTLRRFGIAAERGDRAWDHDHDGLVTAIFETQPHVAMDYFLDRQYRLGRGYAAARFLHRQSFNHRPLSAVSTEDLLSWAAIDPGPRHVRIAANIPLFSGKESQDEDRWWPQALAVLADAPDPAPVLEAYSEQLRPRSWSGSMVDILRRRINALKRLEGHPLASVQAWARDSQALLNCWIEAEPGPESRQYQAFE